MMAFAAPHRLSAAKFELAVLAEVFGELGQPHRVAGPVVAGQAVADALAR